MKINIDYEALEVLACHAHYYQSIKLLTLHIVSVRAAILRSGHCKTPQDTTRWVGHAETIRLTVGQGLEGGYSPPGHQHWGVLVFPVEARLFLVVVRAIH